MKKNIIVTGVTGQDGSYMVEHLLANTDYNILGGVRRLSVPNYKNIQHIKNKRFKLIDLDLSDVHSIHESITKYVPSYFINFAAQSFVGASWSFPQQTFDVNATAVLHILESLRKHAPDCRLYNAGSSEEFGNIKYVPQDEKHPSEPRNPYAVSKCSARQFIKIYRDSFNLFAIQCWLFNHESPRRGIEFVTRKITNGVAKIHLAYKNKKAVEPITLGNLNAQRDWTDARDCVRLIWDILNLRSPNEYVIGSGISYTIKDFINPSFESVGIKGKWVGEGINEKYIYKDDVLIQVSPEFYRPDAINSWQDIRTADISKAQADLNWNLDSSLKDLAYSMVENDISLLQNLD